MGGYALGQFSLRAHAINEGGFGIMPAKVVHHAFTKNECIAQVHGIGPVKRYFK